MQKNLAVECSYVEGSRFYRLIMHEKKPMQSVHHFAEISVNLAIGLVNTFAVEGFLALGTAIGIGIVAVLIKVGWLQ